MVTKNYKPRNTCYRHSSVRKIVKLHNRATRRANRMHLRSGETCHRATATRVLSNAYFD